MSGTSNAEPRQPSSQKLSLDTRLAYGAGNIGLQFLTAGMSFFLMIFYTDVALVPPAVAGAALLVGKIWDTINDPLFGWVTDRTQSRFGRRRVFLIFGAVPLALAASAVWLVPPGLSPIAAFVWIALTYTVYDTLFTVVQLPYAALAAELTHDYDERTRLTTYASAGALLGFILGSVLMPVIVRAASNDRVGYIIAGSVSGMVAGMAVACVAWRVREPSMPASQEGFTVAPSLPVWASVRRIWANRPFVLLSGACALVRLGLTLVQTALAYFVVYQMQGSKEDMPRYLGTMLVVVALSLPLWKRIVDRWEKHYAYVSGLLLSIVGLVLLYWVGPEHPGLLSAVLVLVGLGMGAHWIAPYAMVPDAIDHGHGLAHDSERITGMYYGLFGLVDKLARTFATVLVAAALDFGGYVPNVAQSIEALFSIRMITGMVPAACLLLAVPLLLNYPINRARHSRLIEERLAR